MRDSFDDIRAERDLPYRTNATNSPTHSHAGLWKQIALGIVVGHLSLGLIAAILWVVAGQLLVADLQIVMPWTGQPKM